MGCHIYLTKAINSHHRVDLSRGHRGVPKQFLDDPNVSAAVEKVRRERVAEHVRRYVGTDVGGLSRILDDQPSTLAESLPPVELRNNAGCPCLLFATNEGRDLTR